MSKALTAVAAVIGIAIAAGAGYWAGTRQPAPAMAAASTPPASGKGAGQGGGAVAVEAMKVMTASMPQTITAVGSLRSDESVMLRPEVAGRVAAIMFKEGQRVAKGTPLVRLDTAINDADVKQARANYTLAKSKYDRAIDLQKQNFISAQARDEAESNYKVAEASLALAEAKFAKTELRAPFTGVIGLRSVSVGDYVKEGADIANLEAIDPLKVDFRVPEIYFSQIHVGQPLEVTLDAQPGRTFTGHVLAVNPLVDAAGRSLVLRAVVGNPETTLRPGMFARVKLITRDEKQALVLPEQALVPQGQDQYVFRVVDGKAQRVKVEVGQRRDGKAEILNGLAPQDVVIIAGQLKVRDGTELKVARVDQSNAATAATDGGTPMPSGRKGAGAEGGKRDAAAPAKAEGAPPQSRKS